MLHLVPHRWFSWDFTVSRAGRPVAELDISWWRERGELTIDGVAYAVTREGLMSGAFRLEGASGLMATATKPSAFRRLFVIEHGGTTYTLQPRSAWGRAMVLLSGEKPVGEIAPAGFWSREATAKLPDALPLPVKVFLLWLAVLLWKRDSDAAAAS